MGAAIGAALLAVLGVVVVVARPSASVPAAPSTIERAPTALPPPSSPPHAVPTPTGQLASVPFDSLPVAARDAGAPQGTHHAPRTVAPPTAAPKSAAPKSAPPATSGNKDAWKWGDRN
jgi:hypothetical protein